jgi:hypothetical protein
MMNQTLKFVLVTAAGFALGYTLYGMLQGKKTVIVQKTNGNGNGNGNTVAAKPSPSPEAIGDALAGVLID